MKLTLSENHVLIHSRSFHIYQSTSPYKTPRNRCPQPSITMEAIQNELNEHPVSSTSQTPVCHCSGSKVILESPRSPSRVLNTWKQCGLPTPCQSADRSQLFFILGILPSVTLCQGLHSLLSFVLCHLGYGASLPARPTQTPSGPPSMP